MDLETLLTELVPAQMQWKFIGGALGIPDYEIADIDNKHKNAKNAMREMLSTVLERRSVTRRELAEVLRNDTIKLPKIAAKGEYMQCLQVCMCMVMFKGLSD